MAAHPSLAAGAPDTPAADAASVFALRAAGTIMFAALFLQRFAVPAGGDARIHLASVVALLTVLYGLVTGRIHVNTRSFLIFMALAASASAAALINFQLMLRSGVRLSEFSVIHYLILFVLFTFRMSRPLDQLQVFALYQRFATIIVVCGLAQFMLQFVGLELFTFTHWVPADYLVEHIYNVVIPIAGNDAPYKANGFFLVEPSVFSQVTAIAIAIEIVCFRRMLRLMLMGAGMLVAVSGTGLLVLAVFLALFVFQARNVRFTDTLGLVVAIAAALAIVYLAFPEIFERFADRAGEFDARGSSGHTRFTSVWTGVASAYAEFPDFLWWGVGPGSAEVLTFGGLNTLSKVLIEYGLIGFAIWFWFHVDAVWHRHFVAIVIPVLVFFWTGGTYQQFGPAICLLVGLLSLNPQRDSRPA